MRVLLTGATGFVGRCLYPALAAAGVDVVCASRDPERAKRTLPDRKWVKFDVEDTSSIQAALEGCDGAYFLIHQLGLGKGYPEREATSAKRFAAAAKSTGIGRLVYLGGVAPRGAASRHLKSRLATGEILRQSGVATVELRAAMVIGRGSASFGMVRDLAARLPAMILPSWLRFHSWPVAIDDVVAALVVSMVEHSVEPGIYELPGPERLSHREVLERTARELGKKPILIDVPVLTPTLSSYWIALVTSVDWAIAKELVQGLRSDLDPTETLFWSLLPEHRLQSVHAAICRALKDPAMEDLAESTTRVRRLVERMANRAAP